MLSDTTILAYQSSTDSSRESSHARWWVLFGGILYGTSGLGSNLATASRWLGFAGAQTNPVWDKSDWINFATISSSCIGHAALLIIAIAAMRRARIALAFHLRFATAIVIASSAIPLIGTLGRATPWDAVAMIARFIAFSLWPLIMLWTLSNPIPLDRATTVRRLWIGLAAFELAMATMWFAVGHEEFRQLLSIYSISLDVTRRFTTFAIALTIGLVALVASQRGSAWRRSRNLLLALVICNIALESWALYSFYEVGRRVYPGVYVMTARYFFTVLSMFTPPIVLVFATREFDAMPE
jgi:hypothetical protein